MANARAKQSPRARKSPGTKKTTTKRPSSRKKPPAKRKQVWNWQLPVHVWYETIGIIAILLAIISGFRLGLIGANLFTWQVLLVGVAAPLVSLGLAGAGFACLWYQNKLQPTWRWAVIALMGVLALVSVSGLIQPQQSAAEFAALIDQVSMGSWTQFLFARGGLIGNTLFEQSQNFIGSVGTLLASGTSLWLLSLFLRRKSVADSLQTTVTQTKATVAKAHTHVQTWQAQREAHGTDEKSAYDYEAPKRMESGVLFPDDYFQAPTARTETSIVSEPIGTTEPIITIAQAIAAEQSVSVAAPPLDHDHVQTPVAPVNQTSGAAPQEQAEQAYAFPPITLLNDVPETDLSQLKTTIETNLERLTQLFKSFKIGVTMSGVNVGPAITQYELQPDPGVKVSRIVNLADDIALSLAAKDVRIVAPIPGKAAIGIEVPNPVVAMVSLKQTLAPTLDDRQDKLQVALGKDISGATITTRLDKMPHLLVAGSTGSGKSVCINGIITSLLMRARPDEVKLLLIDPKKVELSYFNHIPHLLSPVVTDAKKAAFALRKIVQEMEARYESFATAGVRNIEGYNEQTETKLPFIVVIIDELADLMLVASKDVEESIMRITQMARAAGIHLIVATQRPSVDVITGVIKANIPSRIAFAVSSQIDSRTILDMSGAEALVGKGDMLFFPSGESKPLRVQGAYVSENEVIQVVDFIKAQQPTIHYDEALLAIQEGPIPENEPAQSDQTDVLLPEVIQFVVEQQKASTSLVQRRFKIGYNRAARLMELMEEAGIIGPNEGTKPRQVLKTTATYPLPQ